MPRSPTSRLAGAVVMGGLLCSMVVSSGARAHHSFSMYDSTKLVSIEGKVKDFQWTNPHVMMWVTKDADPAGEVWTMELPTSPGNLSRMGWNKRSLKAGDHVVVELNPLRDGQHGGSFKKATLTETGQVLVASAPGQNPDDAGVAASPYAPTPATGAAPVPAAGAAKERTDVKTQDPRAVAQAKPNGGCACSVASSAPAQTLPGGAWTALGVLGLVVRRRRAREN
jgi:MYXO-CTERM domain-containing protein